MCTVIGDGGQGTPVHRLDVPKMQARGTLRIEDYQQGTGRLAFLTVLGI